MPRAHTTSLLPLAFVFASSLTLGCSGGAATTPPGDPAAPSDTSAVVSAFKGDDGSKPYTHLRFQNDPDDFQFAIIGDRTGGHRPGVLPAAIDVLNLMRPEFVLGVGDTIEGYTEDEAALRAMWAEADALLGRLEMPFFFVTGNHDVNLGPSEKLWFERAGSDRGYSHFVYKDVLFLLLSTEDPPKRDPGPELAEQYERVKSGKVKGEEAREIVEKLEAWAGAVNISEAQVAYFEKVLSDNPDVRWTLAFMHSPAWTQPDPGNFARIEALLAKRPYTVVAGHTHTYAYGRRNGRDYITMGTTGGLMPPEVSPANMDHVAWVTMTDDGPIISNLILNGVVDKRGAVPALTEFLPFRPRQVTQTGQSLGLRTVPNLRDLGGYETGDGATVMSGLVYRANQLSGIAEGDMAKLGVLGLRNAFDLRTSPERKKRPDELPKGVKLVVLDVLADSPQAGPAQLEKLLADPEQANAQLGGGKVEEGFMKSYREFVSLPSARREFGKLFSALGDPQQLPAVFHCTTGKDRTGWASAALLTLLGVSKEQVYEDYLKSNDYILPAYHQVIESFVAAGGDVEIPRAILGVKPEYLDAAFDQMHSEYGTIENYFAKGLGIDEARQQELRKLFLAKR